MDRPSGLGEVEVWLLAVIVGLGAVVVAMVGVGLDKAVVDGMKVAFPVHTVMGLVEDQPGRYVVVVGMTGCTEGGISSMHLPVVLLD